jgi:peptide/nickel transport system permease protein
VLQFYPTDVMFLLLLAGVCLYGWRIRRNALARERWRIVFRNPAGGAAAIVLVFYFAVGTLDSVRVARHGAVLSVLDLTLSSLRTQTETSYSAPFSAYGYVKETRLDTQGRVQRVYPRLTFGARHLADPGRDRTIDLARRAALGGACGGTWCAISLLLGTRLRRAARAPDGRTPRARHRAVVWTYAALCILTGTVSALCPYYHVFGTDKVGTDVLYQALKSVRTGLVMGTVTTAITLPFALALGLAAGYFRGWVDDAIQYLYTTISSIPGVLLIAAAALALDIQLGEGIAATGAGTRADLKLLSLCGVLGITGWPTLCRLLRAEVLKLRSADFVTAAQALGVPRLQIFTRHLIPNTLHLVLITTVLDFSGLVLAEAVLTYIDIGVDPSMDSWGNMINGARLELAREPLVWWSLLAALGSMFLLVLAANMFADAVRDAFDPQLRGVT